MLIKEPPEAAGSQALGQQPPELRSENTLPLAGCPATLRPPQSPTFRPFLGPKGLPGPLPLTHQLPDCSCWARVTEPSAPPLVTDRRGQA